jgi:acetyl esterase/lipase
MIINSYSSTVLGVKPGEEFTICARKLKWTDDLNKNSKMDKDEIQIKLSDDGNYRPLEGNEFKNIIQYQLDIEGNKGTSFIYKKTDERELKVFVDYPDKWKKSDKRPAILFFFGGGWNGGTVNQFKTQAEYFSHIGLVAVRADYRVKSRDLVEPVECVKDAKSALRWLRKNCRELGVDPGKIISSGGSAGGHLATSTYFSTIVNTEDDDLSISAKPNAMVLFNPVVSMLDTFCLDKKMMLDLVKSEHPDFAGHIYKFFKDSGEGYLIPLEPRHASLKKLTSLAKAEGISEGKTKAFTYIIRFMGFRGPAAYNKYGYNALKDISPTHLLDKECAPVIAFWGDKDGLGRQIGDFLDTVNKSGVSTARGVYEGQKHGFFNKPKYKFITLEEAHKFLYENKIIKTKYDPKRMKKFKDKH